MTRTLKELFDLKNRVAVITGGGGLLGEMHAEAIAELGGVAILIDKDGKRASETAKRVGDRFKTEVFDFSVDITNESQIVELNKKIEKELGPVQILINNAANDPKIGKDNRGVNFSRVENFSLEDWNADFSVGLTGAFICSKVFGQRMAAEKKGVILNIASDLGIMAPDQRIYEKEGLPEGEQPVKPISYVVTKGALITMTKYLATYWAKHNVRSNSLSPGGIYTNQEAQFVTRLSHLIPLGRMAQKDEYKAAVAFLVSDASSYMTGANVVIDGGRSVW